MGNTYSALKKRTRDEFEEFEVFEVLDDCEWLSRKPTHLEIDVTDPEIDRDEEYGPRPMAYFNWRGVKSTLKIDDRYLRLECFCACDGPLRLIPRNPLRCAECDRD